MPASKQSTAKFYVYRNLTRGGFSVKYRGKVILRFDSAFIKAGTFVVNEQTRQRVLQEGKKYVHAFVVSSTMPSVHNESPLMKEMYTIPVRYNPKLAPWFFVGNNPQDTVSGPVEVLFHSNRCWTRTPNRT
jgi:hypothetical protein